MFNDSCALQLPVEIALDIIRQADAQTRPLTVVALLKRLDLAVKVSRQIVLAAGAARAGPLVTV